MNELRITSVFRKTILGSGLISTLKNASKRSSTLPRGNALPTWRLGIDTGAAWDSHIPFLHPDDHEQSRRVWSTCLRTGSAGEMTFRVRNAQGGYRWFLSRVEPLRASDGTLLQWVGVNLDIEELKRAEQALRESEERFRDYAETASDWNWESDRDHKFTRITDYE